MTLSYPETPPSEPRGRLARMPRIVTVLVGAIALAHAATYLLDVQGRNALVDSFAVTPARLVIGDPGAVGVAAALFGHVFLHAGLLHLFFNAMLILQTGELVAERFGRDGAGAARFLALFFGAGAMGALTYIGVNWGSPISAVGASGAASGLFAAYLFAPFLDWRVALRTPTVWQLGFFFLLVNVGLAALARYSGALPIAWEAHLGGFIGGALLYPLLAPKSLVST